jgi:serine/threonine-protein phosphatase 6 regulatory ankyrin repeat subunit B
VNVRDWDELTALIPAASAGHLDICKFLVKEGIDVNAKDKDGITALMEASIMGHGKIVSF